MSWKRGKALLKAGHAAAFCSLIPDPSVQRFASKGRQQHLNSCAGTMTGCPIGAEDTLSFSSRQHIRPMLETVPLVNAAEAYGRMFPPFPPVQFFLLHCGACAALS